MDNRIMLALYKGNRSGKWYSPSVLQARLGDWLIRTFTRSPYSHCEIAVALGSEEHTITHGQYTGCNTKIMLFDCYSASLRDGGVRMKTMTLPADKWDLIPINQLDAYIDVLNYFAQTRGKPYDFIGACGVVLGIKGSLKKWFCSEWCAAALGLQYPDRYSPQSLADWFRQPETAKEKS